MPLTAACLMSFIGLEGVAIKVLSHAGHWLSRALIGAPAPGQLTVNLLTPYWPLVTLSATTSGNKFPTGPSLTSVVLTPLLPTLIGAIASVG
jgi:hypothetical protein